MTRWLDKVTGRVTMYRLVLLFLIALGVESVLLSFTGAISYLVLPILVNAAVLLVVTIFSNRLFALLFRVRPHTESAAITALILFFLFNPIADVFSSSPGALGLLWLALAGVLASASKYVLAFRRRHVFNPAAAGAFLVVLVSGGTAIAGWWVGNPWVAPLTLVFGLVVLFRTRHLALGGIFFVVAVAGVTLTSVVGGIDLGSALFTTITSTPILFFGGFMLSEPLTLPPRRWQQLLGAAIAGVLVCFPLFVGPFYGGYPLALLIVNLLAFLVGQRRGVQLGYLGKKQLSPTSWELTFRPVRPIAFEAGQFMELTLPHAGQDTRGIRRTFSIASAPTATDPNGTVSFGLRTAERSSSFKKTLLTLEPGAVVAATGIGGDFVLPKDATEPILLVAGGIGITPYISHLEHLVASGQQRDVVLVYSSGSASDLPYLDRLDLAGVRVLLVAPDRPDGMPASWQYLGPGPLSAELLLAAVPDARLRRAYVSGAPDLVHSLKPALRRAGVRRVHSDYFSGY